MILFVPPPLAQLSRKLVASQPAQQLHSTVNICLFSLDPFQGLKP
jgi:hypothetical protein